MLQWVKIASGLVICFLIGLTVGYYGGIASVPTTTPTKGMYGGQFVLHYSCDPPTLNTIISGHAFTNMVGGAVFSRLIKRDWEMNFDPDLATSWEVSPDGKTYTFNLLDNATWHDGVPFTSEDVVYSYTEIYPEYFPYYDSYFGTLESVEAPDNYTVTFKLSAANVDFEAYLSQVNGGCILPKHLYEGTDILQNPYNDAPIGTGPFKFVSWNRGVNIILDRNENYFVEGKPYLDRIVWAIIPDLSAAIAAFQAGTVHYLDVDIPLSQIPVLEAIPGVNVTTRMTPSLGVYKIQFNLRDPILNNTKVRQALYYATDKDEINEKVFAGLARVMTGPVANSSYTVDYYNPDVKKYPYDPDMADQLLDEAGYPKGVNGIRFTIENIIPAGGTTQTKYSELLRDQWSKVGVDLKNVILEDMLMIHRAYETWDFQADAILYFGGPTPNIAMGHLQTSQIIPAWFTNNMGYSNATVDALMEAAIQELNKSKRIEMYKEVQAIIMEDPAELYLATEGQISAFYEKFHGLPVPVRENFLDIWLEEEGD